MLLNQSGYGGKLIAHPVLYWGTFGMWGLITVGLFLHIRIARYGFVLYYFYSLATTFFAGVQIFASYEMVVSNLLGLIDGALLVIMFFTSVSRKFEKAPNEQG